MRCANNQDTRCIRVRIIVRNDDAARVKSIDATDIGHAILSGLVTAQTQVGSCQFDVHEIAAFIDIQNAIVVIIDVNVIQHSVIISVDRWSDRVVDFTIRDAISIPNSAIGQGVTDSRYRLPIDNFLAIGDLILKAGIACVRCELAILPCVGVEVSFPVHRHVGRSTNFHAPDPEIGQS